MILPLLSAYFLFAWITDYHNDKKVEEYYEVYAEVQEIKQELQAPSLYDPEVSKEGVKALESDRVKVSLYSKDGFVLYQSTNPALVTPVVSKEALYKDLYELEQGLRTF